MIAWWPGRIPPARSAISPGRPGISAHGHGPRAGLGAGEGGWFSVWPLLQGRRRTNQHEFSIGSFAAERMAHGPLGDWEAVQTTADAPLELYNLKSDRAKPTTSRTST